MLSCLSPAASHDNFPEPSYRWIPSPPAWKELSTWYQISESDGMIPPDVQHAYAEKMNATTLSLNGEPHIVCLISD